MQFYKPNKIVECNIKPADFKISPLKYTFFHKSENSKLSDKESFCHKTSLKRGFRFDHDSWYVNNMERPFFPTEIEARRELARVGLINKNHY